MLTRLVRIQLVIFSIIAVAGLLLMTFLFIQVPTLLGIGKIRVTLELPSGGGLYRFSNVTYRGVQVGKVTDLRLTPGGAQATLSLDTSPRIPADLRAEVRSASAIGEQYVDLRPQRGSGPYLQDGSVITLQQTTIPQAVGPMLDRVSALVGSIPGDKIAVLLDESDTGLRGAGYDLSSLLDSSATVIDKIDGVRTETRSLVDDAVPLLDSQVATTDSLRVWARGLAEVTKTIAGDDDRIRALLDTGPAAADEVTRLLDQLEPTLPVLLANLSTLGQILVTYNSSLEQLLVLLPPAIASTQAFGLPTNNPTGLPVGEFAITLGDPPPCTVGFLPPSSWRSPADTTTIDTPDGLYCKLPQDSPLAVRGARNYPCVGKPGKRAPTVEMCDSDQPFVPTAVRQHAVGPYPLDPNLISQGVPPDSRVNPDDHIFGPPGSPAPGLAPSAFGSPASGRSPVQVIPYSPATGSYVTADGRRFVQSDLGASKAPTSWKDLLPC
ncbi:MCE family protein [Mycolicibacterium aichiense]|uniref:Virulence factor Mce n=1 Tax=Mycolicibacterium aichiense TaxID=1799 RepID=A0AAD1HS97_9MYCO|nr:MlaD family protein [Mycolicibacterium aichiense]MCV7019104.1 MCE family protein [Mycolicibacterium aichiense]BBX08346.1 virulence factor Mce [Mycolicibacterium aichiense]STZ82147.1 Virulence factor Mce family protein [Mycolicibacterium aichiense]